MRTRPNFIKAVLHASVDHYSEHNIYSDSLHSRLHAPVILKRQTAKRPASACAEAGRQCVARRLLNDASTPEFTHHEADKFFDGHFLAVELHLIVGVMQF